MGWLLIARILFVGSVCYVGSQVQPLPGGVWVNAGFGLLLAAVVVVLETRLRDAAVTTVLGALLGGGVGLAVAKMVETTLAWAAYGDRQVAFLRGFLLLVLPFIGVMMGARKGEWLEPAKLFALFRAAGPKRVYKVLDTSVIIDGRIADICEAGFMDGTLVVPQFILKELQLVADSADPLKRNRGRRGLDILQKIQKMAGVQVMISDVDFPDVREVDLKLIELARSLPGKIVTNDLNLNKVAQLRGVDVLNINQLANALKPVVLPGEILKVFILKEGKEYNQGVAYLDDGTMVVVDNARKLIGRTIDIVVTSVLQTTAGKMIFGRHIDTAAPAAAQAGSPAPQGAAPAASDKDRDKNRDKDRDKDKDKDKDEAARRLRTS